jgi:hypothetical protein
MAESTVCYAFSSLPIALTEEWLMRISGPLILLVVLSAALGASSCGANQTIGPSRVVSTDLFIRAIEDQGVRVTRMEEMPQQSYPFFSVPAQRLMVAGENVYVFQYGSSDDADGQAARISRDGSTVGTSSISWIAPPRFYKKEPTM